MEPSWRQVGSKIGPGSIKIELQMYNSIEGAIGSKQTARRQHKLDQKSRKRAKKGLKYALLGGRGGPPYFDLHRIRRGNGRKS